MGRDITDWCSRKASEGYSEEGTLVLRIREQERKRRGFRGSLCEASMVCPQWGWYEVKKVQ